MCERQAGAEIKITPEMIEAGVSAYARYYSDTDFEWYVREMVGAVIQAAFVSVQHQDRVLSR